MSPYIWLAIGFVIMALEIIVPGFIIFWFGLGGVITAIFTFMKIATSLEIQFLIFFISSFAFLLSWQFYFKKKFKIFAEDESRDATLTNLKGKVTKKIIKDIPGEVELYENFHGIKIWKAESEDDIEVGEEIIVKEAKGITLIVKKNGGNL